MYPEKLPNDSRVVKIYGIDFIGSEIKRSKSSAYRDTLCSTPCLSIPVNSLLALRAIDRGSITIAKRSGEIGHPCLVPRESGKKSDCWLLVDTRACGKV